MNQTQQWEMFYTTAREQTDEFDTLVDQVSIDTKNKRYILDINASSLVTDGYDEFDNEIYSSAISREVFDLLLFALKSNGYREIKWSEEESNS